MSEAQRLDEIIDSLSSLPHAPILLDGQNRDRVRAVLARLSDPDTLASMTAAIHGLIRRNQPLTPFLLAVNQLLSVDREDLLEDFFDLFTSFSTNGRMAFQFLGLVLRLLDRSSDALSPWLLLTRHFLDHGGTMDRLLRLQEITASNPRSHPGDSAARLLHLSAQFRSAGYPPQLAINFIIDSESGGVSHQRFFRAMDHFFPLPLKPADFTPELRIRRLSGRTLFLSPGEQLLAVPLDMLDGILPPGCLKWFSADGRLLNAGYFFSGGQLAPGTQTLELECENFSGKSKKRKIRITRAGGVGINEPHFHSDPYPDLEGSPDPLSLFFGYLEGLDLRSRKEIQQDSNKEVLQAAQNAYGAEERLQNIARLIQPPAPRPVSSELTEGRTLIIY